MATDPLAHLHYLEVEALRALQASWDASDPVELRAVLVSELSAIGDVFVPMSVNLAATWYAQERLDAGWGTPYRIDPPDIPDQERWTALAVWGSLPLFEDISPDVLDNREQRAWGRVSGGLQRTVVDSYRNTITRTAVRDKASRGWRRVGGGKCLLCARKNGLSLTSDVVFDSHDNCRCRAVPEWNPPPESSAPPTADEPYVDLELG